MPAPEGSRARGKRGATVLAAALTALLGTAAQAGPQLPTGGQVTAGAATIQQAGSTLTVQQATRNAAIDWQQFSIGAGGTVRFDQPSSASVALNRVVGQDASQIMGSLQANGQVFLVNPSGILFGQGAQVSTAGLLASTRDISSADFATGQFRFSGSGTGTVVNQGTLTARQGGYVALIGAQVVNAGTIQAPGGDVRLAAADAVAVRIDGAGLAGFTVERGTLDGLVANHGLIQANGGRVALTADAADALAKAVVNQDGIIEAQAVASQNGTVELRADSQVGQVDISGRIDVSSATGTGGTATATAHAVNLGATAAIDASGSTGGGKVLIGGGWQGQDTSIANASTVTMAPGARIDVSARDNGNGGTAVLWSQDGTAFAGDIAARGGALGGSGGKVETSSHDVLQAIGSVDASAAAGAGGQWLLDPRNVTIAATGASGTAYGGGSTYNGSSTFTPGADSIILASTIANTLNAGSSVTITTGSSGTSLGDINVNAAIVTNGVYSLANTLSLLAAHDININARIADTSSTYFNRLNVVLTPGAAGNVGFGSGGSITTLGGNVYIGSVSGTGYSEAVTRMGQNLTMAAGSYIDTAGGLIDAKVNGTITLAANSLRNSGGTAYYNSSPYLSTQAGNYIGLTGASIVSTNTDAATPDITAQANVLLSAGSIGSSINPIKISGYSDDGSAQLGITNTAGNSYVNEIGLQAFRTVTVDIGSQINSTQDIRLLEDFGGDGHSGTGHLLLNTDGAGVLNLATGDISTATTDPNKSNNVQISAGNITFADGSVNTGTGSFRAAADSLTAAAGSAANNIAEIIAPDLQLVGRNVGTLATPLELAAGDTTGYGQLTVNNTGGSTFLKVVDDKFLSVSLNHEKDTGTHSVLFSGGDHLDYSTDGSNIVLPTISGGASDGSTFGATTGLDATRGNRYVSITANSGGVRFGDDSVNLGYGAFSTTVAYQNGTGTIAAVNSYNSGAPVAQITAGDVSFNVLNEPTPGVSSIGAGGKDIQIAQGLGASDNYLSVSTQQGNVAIQELTQNHFKHISVSLGSASAAQNIAIGLQGADDINFSDSGSLVSIDATKVNVASGDRAFSLSAGARSIEIDGQSPSAGDYSIYAGNLLKLNSDITSNGGNISLYGVNGIDLMRSVRIDSNADRSGPGGSVSLNTNGASASISGTAAGQTLTIDTSSADATGGTISMSPNVDGRAGAFLAGLTLQASGADTSRDGSIYIGNSNDSTNGASIKLNGDFSATGDTSINAYYGFSLDTEQGNTAAGGNISFAGADLTSSGYYNTVSFNSSTSALNANAGNISLATQNASGNGIGGGAMLVDARSTGGGTAGDVTLDTVTTTSLYGGPGTQTYYGRTITLNGDLGSSGKNIALNGEVRLAHSVTIDSNSGNSGSSGSVTIAGAVSATAAGAGLVIDTSSPDSSGGGVQITGVVGSAGGYNLDSLTINAAKGSSGTAGSIILGRAIATEGAQTYAGGALSTSGGLSTNGGNIDLRNTSAVTLSGISGSAYTITTDRAGGSNAAGALLLGGKSINGPYVLTIDTTADGGGAAADLSLVGVGASTVFNSINIAAGNITLAGTARASGAVTMEARGANADLTITSAGAVISGSGNNIVLAAGRNFVNNRGTLGVLPGASYYVYSSNPTGTVEGLTGYGKHYNQTYTAGSTPSYAGSGNWFFYSIAPVISVASNAGSIVYGSADPSLALGSGNYSGFIDGDTLAAFGGSQTLSLAAAGTLSGAGYRQAGNYAYTLNGTLTDSLGYQYAPFSQTLTVTPRDLAISGIAASNRDYDGTTNANLTGSGSATALAGDAVTVDTTGMAGSFVNANAGVGKTVSVNGIVVGGTDSANYTAVQPTNVTATIAPKALSISGSTVVDKTYDGNTGATVAAGTLAGLVGSETLGVSGTGSYADKNAGTGKSVSAAYTLADAGAGGLASNYSLAGETLTGTITPKTLAITATASDKVYDGGLGTGGYSLSMTNLVGNDSVYFGGNISSTFTDKNVGTNKAVNIAGIGIAGTDAGNYALASTTASATASITAKSITVAATGVGKVYDGGTGATALLASTGVVNGDTVDFSGTASYADKNAGTGKTVSVAGIGASGTDAGNYTLNNTTALTTATIAQKAITVAATGIDRVYDGGTAAQASLASADVVSGDTVAFNGSASFADKNAGTGKAVSVTGIASSGTDAGNYSLNNTTAQTSASIGQKAITVAATGVNKVYDGSTAASANLASAGVVNGDTVDFTGTATLSDKNVGIGKAVGVAGIASSGTDAGNYSLNNATASTTANVSAKAITVAATGVDKVYDGSTAASANLASAGVVQGDTVSFTGTATLADKNVGTGKTVNVAGIASNGTDAGNYTLTSSTAATTADVTAKAITVAASGVNKVYDGSTAASANLASAGVVQGDTVSFTGTATLADKNVGTGKAVSVAGIASNGADAGNYTLVNSTAATTADVTAKAITVAASGVNKVYDGSTAASANLASAGVVQGDTVAFTGTATLADKNVGTGKAVSVAGIASNGTDAGNYTLVNSTAATTADVTAKAITVAATGVNKVYDGSTSASANLASAGVVQGDTVDFTGTATLADKNVGTGKAVSVAGIASNGTDAGNYTLVNSTAATTADVTAKAITVAASGINKVYDGSTAASANLASAGVVEGDVVSFSGTATLSDKNVGTGKAVGVAGIGSSGTDAGNYTLVNSTAATTADVTAKAITVAATGVNKVYDGSTAAAANLASAGVVEGDTVAFTGTATLADKNVGTGKAVSVAGIASNGTDAGNYTLVNSTAATTADVTAKAITVAATGVNKVYDGSTAAAANLASAGVVEGDTVAFTGTATLADKNVGTGKAVTVAGISASGADAGNYTINGSASTTADVAAKAITVAATGVDKVYDGSTAATANLASAGVVAGDSIAFGGTATLADKNVGTGKTVSVVGIASSGTDAGNYSLVNTTAETTASVSQKAITVAATGVNKVYDGSTAASANLASAGVVAGDTVAFSGTATLADKNVGTGKTVSVAGIVSSGADAGNYALDNSTAGTTADVTPKSITVAATGVGKVYDGSTAVGVQLASNGLVAGDVVSFNGTGTLADKNAGSGKAVAVSGIAASGTDAANYQVNASASTTADVAQRQISVTLDGLVVKADDGNTSATLRPANYAIQGLVAGESITVTQTAGSFADTAVAKGKTVTTTLGAADYRGDGQTLVSNYQTYAGSLSAPIGEIQDAVTTSASYLAAINASATISTNVPTPQTERNVAEVQDDTQQHQGTARRNEATVVSTNTRENLLFRRTFSIGDGGIRLPAGVVGSDKDASQ